MVLIHIFQRPTWTYKLDREGDWKNHDLYPSFELTYLNPVTCNVLYMLCLAVLWTATTLEFGYKRYTSNINLVYLSAVILAIKSVTVLVCLDVERKGFLTYTQADELLQEMYEFYEDIRTKPTAAERYELILVLDIQSNMMIDENDFSFLEEKCFADVLKRLRSRKRKLIRYMAASILRDRLGA